MNQNINRFFEECSQKLIRFLMKKDNDLHVNCKADAKAIISDAFTELLERAETEGVEANISGQYCYTYIQKMCVNIAHKRHADKYYALCESIFTYDNDEYTMRYDACDIIDDSEDTKLKHEQLDFIDALIASQLSDKQRELVMGRVYGDEPYTDLAEELGYAGDDGARVTMQRIKKKLRAIAAQSFVY